MSKEPLWKRIWKLYSDEGLRPSEIAAIIYPELYTKDPKRAVRRVWRLIHYALRKRQSELYNQEQCYMDCITDGEDFFDEDLELVPGRYELSYSSIEAPLVTVIRRGRIIQRERDIRDLKSSRDPVKRMVAELQHLASLVFNLRSDSEHWWKIFNAIKSLAPRVLKNEKVWVRGRHYVKASPRAAAFIYLIYIGMYSIKPQFRHLVLRDISKLTKIPEEQILEESKELLPELSSLFL